MVSLVGRRRGGLCLKKVVEIRCFVMIVVKDYFFYGRMFFVWFLKLFFVFSRV